jgi:predicted transcriptional regulator
MSYTADFLADVNELVRQGLITVRVDDQVILTDKGLELIDAVDDETGD